MSKEKPPETRSIEIAKIKIEDQKLRRDPTDDDVVELSVDIASHGMMQPVGVTPLPDGFYQLRWGGRRLAAHQRLRQPTIWARIYEPDDESVKTTALRENIQRLNISLQEEIDGVLYLNEKENKSPDQISTILGKGRQWVLRRMAIPQLPQEVKEALIEGRISLGAAEEISRCPDEGSRRYIISQTIQANYTVHEVRDIVKAVAEAASNQEEIETAVQAGLNATPAPEPQLICNNCGIQRPISKLQMTIIRCCAEGCEPLLKTEQLQ